MTGLEEKEIEVDKYSETYFLLCIGDTDILLTEEQLNYLHKQISEEMEWQEALK